MINCFILDVPGGRAFETSSEEHRRKDTTTKTQQVFLMLHSQVFVATMLILWWIVFAFLIAQASVALILVTEMNLHPRMPGARLSTRVRPFARLPTPSADLWGRWSKNIDQGNALQVELSNLSAALQVPRAETGPNKPLGHGKLRFIIKRNQPLTRTPSGPAQQEAAATLLIRFSRMTSQHRKQKP